MYFHAYQKNLKNIRSSIKINILILTAIVLCSIHYRAFCCCCPLSSAVKIFTVSTVTSKTRYEEIHDVKVEVSRRVNSNFKTFLLSVKLSEEFQRNQVFKPIIKNSCSNSWLTVKLNKNGTSAKSSFSAKYRCTHASCKQQRHSCSWGTVSNSKFQTSGHCSSSTTSISHGSGTT